MTRKGKLMRIFKQLLFSAEPVPKIIIVILSVSEESHFPYFKRGDPSD
jgi:hypothetical protein